MDILKRHHVFVASDDAFLRALGPVEVALAELAQAVLSAATVSPDPARDDGELSGGGIR